MGEGTRAAAERRQITVLFADIVGFTSLSEQLDPEDLHALVCGYRSVCREAVVRFTGRVAQYVGDGVMAYFGVPAVHEDDAVRACYASLQILEGMKYLNTGIARRLGVTLHVRLGLHTGMVLIGDVHFSDERDHAPASLSPDALAVGDTPNIASRIQSLAPPDGIVASDVTAQLVRGYVETVWLGEHEIKGFTRQRPLHRIVARTEARTRLQAAALTSLTPYVGRAEQLQLLGDTWRSVCDGAGRAVIVRGEPGIGKSRIVNVFLESAADDGGLVVEVSCSELTQWSALAPVIQFLDARMRTRAADSTPMAKRQALQEAIGEHSRFGPDAFALVGSLLGYPDIDESPLKNLSPVRRRARLLEVLRDWLASWAELTPTVACFDDLHWADPTTLDLIDLFMKETLRGRTMICLTARLNFPERWSGPNVHTISLNRLPNDEAGALVTRVVGGRMLSPEAVASIVGRSEGVPLYLEELTKAALEQPDRTDQAGQGMSEGDGRAIPAAVRKCFEARFHRLGESRQVAQIGAAIGREFSYEMVRAAYQGTDAELVDHLENLGRAELISTRGEPPHATYVFKHALIQGSLYDTLAKEARRQVHERIFLKIRNATSGPELAAHHAEQAGRISDAVPLLSLAGQKALERTAVVEAVTHFKRAIGLLQYVEEPERTWQEIELQSRIMPALMAHLGWAAPEVETAASRLRELANSRGDNQKLYAAMWGLWTVHFVRGELHAALDIAQNVYKMARGAADPISKITACHALGYTCYYRADLLEARRIAKEGIALYELETERKIVDLFQLSSGSITQGFCTAAHWLLGEQDQAAERRARWHEVIKDLKHAPSSALSWAFEGYVLHMLRDAPELRKLALRLRTISEQEGFRLWISMSHVFEAWARAHEGDVQAAIDQMNEGIAGWRATHSHLTMCDNTVMQAEVLLLARRTEDALPVLALGKEICAKSGERTLEPELYRLEGEALATLGRRDEAASAYRNAVVRARELRTLSLELRAAMGLHRLVRSSATLAELRDTYGKFTEGLERPELNEAKSLLSTGGISHGKRVAAE
ncbi:MAG TPA: AAA family ATPase [Polyangiaceae bacterium]|nr:AAA family ATPase [Polyangiaceae bacterium]